MKTGAGERRQTGAGVWRWTFQFQSY